MSVDDINEIILEDTNRFNRCYTEKCDEFIDLIENNGPGHLMASHFLACLINTQLLGEMAVELLGWLSRDVAQFSQDCEARRAQFNHSLESAKQRMEGIVAEERAGRISPESAQTALQIERRTLEMIQSLAGPESNITQTSGFLILLRHAILQRQMLRLISPARFEFVEGILDVGLEELFERLIEIVPGGSIVLVLKSLVEKFHERDVMLQDSNDYAKKLENYSSSVSELCTRVQLLLDVVHSDVVLDETNLESLLPAAREKISARFNRLLQAFMPAKTEA